MGTEILREVLHGNNSDENSRNCLIKQLLENNGDFHSQTDWLCFLASAFNIPSSRSKQPGSLDISH